MNKSVSRAEALMLAALGFARAIDLPQLKDARKVAMLLRLHFKADSKTMHYAAKVLRAAPPADSESTVQTQTIRQLCGNDELLKHTTMQFLVDLAKDEEGTVDALSRKALGELAATLNLPAAPDIFVNTPLPSQDPHRVLGVSPQASVAQITEAYRELMQQTHPDRWGHVENKYTRERLQEKSARINAAYEKLTKNA